MKFDVLLSYWVIVVGGLMIFIGWPPREPICIVCTPTLTLAAGVISLALGIVGAARSFGSRSAQLAR